MIVSNAQIYMGARQAYREERKVSESLEFWANGRQPDTRVVEEEPATPSVDVDISQAGSLLARYRQQQTVNFETQIDARSRLNLMIIEAMYKSITGKDLSIVDPSELATTHENPMLSIDTPVPARTAPVNSGPGLVYQRRERYQETETLSFAAVGVVKTADGRELHFSAALSMNRDFVQESNLEIRQGSAQKIDPLVINFDGLGAQLSQTRFEFDLDNNGTAEQIASLRPGSGYLALDRNSDDIINNGSELFGPSSGRGFAELAVYDEDGNNFIDEADSVYHQLRIWITNEDGSSQLAALGDKNIGAIFLGHVTSPFQLKDANNNSLGEVANSGIYLTEDGKAGVIQEINLSV